LRDALGVAACTWAPLACAGHESRGIPLVERDALRLRPSEVAVVDRGQPWLLHAESDCAVLLTLAWPPEKVGV